MGTPLVPEVPPAVLIRVSSGADSHYLAVLMWANTHKVFGHSLAKADFAYFQAIIDIVDLYTVPVELVLFYKSYCETAREELLLNISRLLDSYGASMNNRDHGKNLMRRLILEGRLSVVELP